MPTIMIIKWCNIHIMQVVMEEPFQRMSKSFHHVDDKLLIAKSNAYGVDSMEYNLSLMFLYYYNKKKK